MSTDIWYKIEYSRLDRDTWYPHFVGASIVLEITKDQVQYLRETDKNFKFRIIKITTITEVFSE